MLKIMYNNKQEAIQDYLNRSDYTITENDLITWENAKGNFCIRLKGTKGVLSLAVYNLIKLQSNIHLVEK